jgi:hypothetical protein
VEKRDATNAAQVVITAAFPRSFIADTQPYLQCKPCRMHAIKMCVFMKPARSGISYVAVLTAQLCCCVHCRWLEACRCGTASGWDSKHVRPITIVIHVSNCSFGSIFHRCQQTLAQSPGNSAEFGALVINPLKISLS